MKHLITIFICAALLVCCSEIDVENNAPVADPVNSADTTGTSSPADTTGTVTPEDSVTVIDAGKQRPEKVVVRPHFPDSLHSVAYDEFYGTGRSGLDDYDNIAAICSKGKGTSDPFLTSDYTVRFYQGKNSEDGGGYLQLKSENGAKIMEIEVGTASNTSLAYSIDDKIKKYNNTEVKAGGKYKVSLSEPTTQVNIYCTGTTQQTRWDMNYLRVDYKGGFVAEDYAWPEEEYGPLVGIPFPFKEDFEKGFPDAGSTPSYFKYGRTDVGRPNLLWSTWYGNFSWQNTIGQSEQSAQLRMYQEDPDYEKSQYGYLKTEFFVKDLSSVTFDYYMSEFFIKASVSYCEFGTSEWKNPQIVSLSEYNQRQTERSYTYILDGGIKHDAKIKIEIDPSTGFPSKDHYDFIIDNVVFK